MTKEDKQIIDRATKEEWRIGDRTRLKRLLEKNLKLYRENVELENKIADIKANCDLAIEGRDVKIMELEKENAKLKSIGRTAYIKGIRTMANALKDYDRADGAWTDYFEHKVNEVLKKLLGEIEK